MLASVCPVNVPFRETLKPISSSSRLTSDLPVMYKEEEKKVQSERKTNEEVRERNGATDRKSEWDYGNVISS